MKNDIKEQIDQVVADWQYLTELPETLYGFHLTREAFVHDNFYDICRYDNPELHKSAIIYYHDETHEYKVRVKLGLIEFCRIEFITADLAVFEKLLRRDLDAMLHDMVEYNPNSVGCIVREKGILAWEGAKRLPQELEGFTLFVHPDEPVKITNGSYVLIDYADFALESSFTIYYNIYRDEFFGEARICNIPDVNYDFDASELPELEERLKDRLRPRLREVRERAEAEQTKQDKAKEAGA